MRYNLPQLNLLLKSKLNPFIFQFSGLEDSATCNEGDNSNVGICDRLYELIMWKDVAKSTLWFGLGSIFFLSTSFSKDFNFRYTK